MRMLERLTIQNFKSIREQELRLGQLNLFIGGNGAGKSNLIQTFRFLREIATQNLATYSLERGADSLLYFGRKTSPFMELIFEFGDSGRGNAYRVRLKPTDENALIVSAEIIYRHEPGILPRAYDLLNGSGSREAALAISHEELAAIVRRDLDKFRLYHFHDTSDSSLMKIAGPLDDNHFLRSDASNLAAFLYLLQQRSPNHFRNIEDAVRQIAPFFDKFNLAPSRLNPERIRLEWQEKGNDTYFNATALSDGTLRFMCLATLLLQPNLPSIILLDEPELGLHPAAITLLSDLLSSAATKSQVLVATQSVTLVNQFEPEHVWTVDRADGQSVFRHLGNEDLKAWLGDYEGYAGYGLGELWEKNILGARP
jgi:predicted ATPase